MADKRQILYASDGTEIPALWHDNGDGTYSQGTTATLSGTVTASTEYTEDAAAAANPTGGMLLGRRKDTLSAAEVSADGDVIALNATAKGELYVKQTDAVTVSTHDVGNITTGVVPGTGATNLGKAEDAAHTSGDVGVMALAVRNDAGTALAGTTGDYIPLTTDSSGALRVTGGGGGTQYAEDAAHTSGDSGTLSLAVRRDANTSLVDATGDYAPLQVDATGSLKVAIISGAGSGGTASTDDAAFTPAVGSGTPIMGMADEVAPDSVDEGDVGVVRMTLARGLHVNLRSAAGTDAVLAEDAAAVSGDPGIQMLAVRADTAAATAANGDYHPLLVDSNGALHVTQGSPGTGATNLGKAEDAAHADGDVGVMLLAVRNDNDSGRSGTDGDYTPINVDNTGRVKTLGQGNLAHDAVDAGNPVKMGAKAVAHGANPTAVAAADRTDLYANRHGIQFVIGGHPNTITTEFEFTSAQTNQALVTVSAGSKIVVTAIDATVDKATTVDVGVRIGLAAATLSAAASSGVTGIVLSHPGIAAGSGIVKGSGAGILAIGADGEDLRITSEAATSGALRVTVTHYTIES